MCIRDSAYPGSSEPGLNNNAYTNVMVVWVLKRALDLIDILPEIRWQILRDEISLKQEELDRWEDITRKMKVVFHENGIISQFEGYDKLKEFDWDGYKKKYGNIQRLDRILEAEGDTPNNYKVSKQADVLMLFYLLTAEEMEEGYCLACQTKVEGTTEVFIPPESRVIEQKILVQSLAMDTELDSTIWQTTLSIVPPEEENNIADAERLLIALGKQFPKQPIVIPYEVLRTLPTRLRAKNWEVTTILQGDLRGIKLQEILTGKVSNQLLGLALDVGTTTIAAHLINLETGKTLASATTFNSQMLYGEDIITRIHFASTSEQNLQKLHKLVINDINKILQSFQVNPEDIRAISVAGNTVMTHLLYNIDPSFIWREPYTPVATHFPVLKASQFGLKTHQQAEVFAFPCVSSYVGGDVVGGILISKLYQKENPSLLVDIGTNGEIVLGCSSWLLSCSVPAGPALEGAEVKCGMRAALGAIESINLDQETLEPSYSVIGKGKPLGICGSGLIDLLAELFSSRALTKSGELQLGTSKRIRESEVGLEYLLVEGSKTATGKAIVLTEADITNLLKTKGAFYAGYTVLLRMFGLTFQDLDSFYIAGGFGTHINAKNAITIGLYPDIPLEKIQSIGNGSLGGAAITLLSKEKRSEIETLARSLTNIELSNNYEFMDEYTLASFIPHTHLELFPSVQQLIKLGGIKH